MDDVNNDLLIRTMIAALVPWIFEKNMSGSLGDFGPGDEEKFV